MNAIQPRGGEGVAQVSVRLPVGLHAAVKAEAQARGQSVNTLIVMNLRKEVEATAQK
ncbi:toxin-antitoxin system HicB family antitoxin [Salipiger mucosus]|uniref:toxin-antitoxin system HicB family antitoxin n=1 Tax=Salipiger mucosus TaxID=263378 RepID=UPI0003613C09|nr:toxin-antitoxin system HicB family antitoxin [Salipiger mucosus]